MGKLSSQPQPSINHFSHPHPLQLYNYQPQQTLSLASCSGCKVNAAGWVYSCTSCNYILHIKCSEMPQQITHPCDRGHVLSLNPIPIYPEGCFKCDACGLQGNGFSYHCKACDIDLHIRCASMPLLLTHQSHHHHLNLTFSPPYLNKSFSCDICKNTGLNHWLYRCNLCEFDAHLNCAMTKPRAPVQAPPCPPQALIQMQQCQTRLGASTPQFQVLGTQYTARPALQNCIGNNLYANPGIYGQTGRTGQGNVLLNQAIQGLVSGASEATGQILLQGLMGNGGGGSGSVGGGGGDLLQGLMGGGGGDVNLLQRLIGGGGGGGGGGGVYDGGSFSAFDSSTGIDGGLGGFEYI